MIVDRRFAVALAAVAMLTVRLPAQDKGKGAKPAAADACALDYEKPSELKEAQAQITFAQIGKAGDPQKKALSKAIEKLSRRADYYLPNTTSQAFLLGEALVLWSAIPGVPPSMRRGDLGFLGDKDQQLYLLKAADSLFTIVEKAMPGCADQTSVLRRPAWARYINRVGPLINADKIPEATAVLDSSMVIYRDSPFTLYFEGQIAYNKDEYGKASEFYEKGGVIGAAQVASDSTLASITERNTFLAPYAGARAAATMSGADQVAAFKRIATLYSGYLKTYPCGAFSEAASSGLFEALRSAADTTGLRMALEVIAKEDHPCTDISWYNAARDASDANLNALAVQLSDKAVANDPWSAALGSAGGAYWKAEAWTKLVPVALRLTQIAPNSADNWQMLALAYQGLDKTAATPAAKKAYSDSLVSAYNMGEALTVKVRIATFTSDGAKRTIGGTMELVDNTPGGAKPKPKPKPKPGQAKPAPAPAAPPAAKLQPRSVTLKIEFIDRDGKALAVKDSTGASVPGVSQTFTVKPDEKTDFKFVVTDPKIVGYRYAPIPAAP